ncbi:MAG: Fic family protein [Candidatus Caenarcaniphilales bacterium]|jgi:hypothetical protein|nr:Fic family protein [Candidatus Caenarcaniphilales bacterium]
MGNLNQRQEKILEILLEEKNLNINYLSKFFPEISQKTLSRDLNFLQEINFIEKNGKAKATSYSLSSFYELNKTINRDDYFSKETDERAIQKAFVFSIFEDLQKNSSKLLTQEEKKHIETLTKKFIENKSKLSTTIIKKEFERLTIELAWKSSKIEGNTYSLLDTETLLKTGIKNPQHSEEDAQMLLNHKSTIEHILSDSEEYKQLNINNLIDLHSLLISKLAIDKHIRRRLVGITGTNYRPLDNEFQIKEALEKTFDLVNNESEPFIKAILVSALLAYIQAFEDANKRLSRMTTNAILIAHNYCPLSYRSIDVNEYKKAVLLFYEQNNIKYLKELLINQYEFAVNNYFCI